MYTDVNQKNQDTVLSFVMFAYNTKQETTGFTTFFVVHICVAQMTMDMIFPFNPDYVNNSYNI